MCSKEEDVAQAILAARAGDYDRAITHLEASEALIHELVGTSTITIGGLLLTFLFLRTRRRLWTVLSSSSAV